MKKNCRKPNQSEIEEILDAVKPLCLCSFCEGAGCASCDELGAKFSDIVLRGHDELDGFETVLEGYCPVKLHMRFGDGVFVFDRATEGPYNHFVKEDGKQVYVFERELEDEKLKG